MDQSEVGRKCLDVPLNLRMVSEKIFIGVSCIYIYLLIFSEAFGSNLCVELNCKSDGASLLG